MKQYNRDKILQDLYALDPTLQDHEFELKQILTKMLESKPDVPIDQDFVTSLRRNILQMPVKSNFRFFNFFPMKSPYILGATVLGTLAIALVAISTFQNPSLFHKGSLRGQSSSIAYLKTSAFGPLSMSEANAPLGSQAARSSLSSSGGAALVPPLEAGAEKTMNVNSAVINPVTTDAAVGKMIAPVFYSYTFKYTGEPLTLTEANLPVYKRVKGSLTGNPFSNYQSTLLDISKFRNLKVQNISFFEDRDDGYNVNIDMINSTVSVNPVYERWYPSKCDNNGNCESPRALTEKDIPADEEVIALANNFLDSFGVNRSQYAAPKVDNTWKIGVMPLLERRSEMMFIPDVLTVVYPLIIEGQVISEGNGEMYGLRVNVDVRKKKAQSLWNLVDNRYEKSDYAAETDANRILKIAERGAWGAWYDDASQKKVINLGTPEKIYIPHYQYIPDTQMNNELFIPALRFPVLNAPEDQAYFQKYVVVPLIQEVLPQYEGQTEEPVRILLKKAEDAPVQNQPSFVESQGIRAPDATDVSDPSRRY